MKHELQNIISGKSQVRFGDVIQKISSYIRTSESTSKKIEFSEPIESKETAFITQFCNLYDFWITEINTNAFVSPLPLQSLDVVSLKLPKPQLAAHVFSSMILPRGFHQNKLIAY